MGSGSPCVHKEVTSSLDKNLLSVFRNLEIALTHLFKAENEEARRRYIIRWTFQNVHIGIRSNFFVRIEKMTCTAWKSSRNSVRASLTIHEIPCAHGLPAIAEDRDSLTVYNFHAQSHLEWNSTDVGAVNILALNLLWFTNL